jgi:hypothetical protein
MWAGPRKEEARADRKYGRQKGEPAIDKSGWGETGFAFNEFNVRVGVVESGSHD